MRTARKVHLALYVWIALLAAGPMSPGSSRATSPASAGPAVADPVGPHPVPGWPVILGNGIHGAAAVADFNGDGRDELAVAVRDGRIFLLDGHGRTLPGWPQSAANAILRSPLVADLDGDGDPEIVAAASDGFLHAWRRDGQKLPGWPVDLGVRAASAPRLSSSAGAAASVLLGCVDGRIHLLDGSGVERPGWPRTVAPLPIFRHDTASVACADLDGDGRPEILCLCRRPAVLHVWNEAGEPRPGFPVTLEGDGVGLAVDADTRPARIACAVSSGVALISPDGVLRRRWALPDPDDLVTSPPAFVPLTAREGSPPAPPAVFAGTFSGEVCLWDEEGFLPGWPVRLGGFIYGLEESIESFAIKAVPGVRDLDGDGRPDLVIGSQDQHLYGFDLDGTPLPGWPVVLDDWLEAPPVFAQLDGVGGEELVIGQIGETLFAFCLDAGDPHAAGRTGVPPAAPAAGAGSAGLRLAGVAVAILVLAVLIVARLRRGPATGRWGRGTRLALALTAVLLLLRLGLLAGEAWRYHEVRAQMADLDPVVNLVLENERLGARNMAAVIAAGLSGTDVRPSGDPLALLYEMERLADRERLDDRRAGLMVVDPDGRVRQAFGLARGWRTIAPLVKALKGREPALLGSIPVAAAAESLSGGERLVVVVSLLARLPQAIADATGYSAQLCFGDRVLAYGGAPPHPRSGVWPWAGRVEPVRSSILAEAGGSRLVLRLGQEDFQDARLGWFDFGLLLLLPILFFLMLARRPLRPGRLPGWAWSLAATAAYVSGWWLLAGGAALPRSVPLGGHMLELALHLAGLLAAALALRLLVGSRRSRRLSFALLGSYLAVGLLPLAVLLTVSTGLFQEAQRRAFASAIADLQRRGDNLLLAYMGNQHFMRSLDHEAEALLDEPVERAWLNFVADQQLLFTYDLPSAYLTLRLQDRAAPDRSFTGYSYRAPRGEKFYASLPSWTGGRNLQGLFVADGEPVVRAVRRIRTARLDGHMIAHLPLDRAVREKLESRLRILPVLPRVALEPIRVTEASPPHEGHRLPLSTRLVLPARDWETGAPRLIVYRAQALLPPGGEMWRVLLPSILLLLLPLGLSTWGAASSYKRTVRPLSRLLTGIRRVETGDLDYRLGDTGRDEIAAAARAFDRMAESLQTTVAELAEKKKVEEVSALKSRFISMVSHDLKTPLAAITGAAENIIGGLAGRVTDRQRTYLQMILASSENLQRMIADILDLSRLESGHIELELEPLDLRRETENVLRSLAPLVEERRLDLRFVCPAVSTRLAADRTRLWQVLGNILSNGIRHAPPGSVLEVRIEEVFGPGCEPQLRVRVLDRGPGVPASERDRIFEPFYARPAGPRGHPGAGLGLAIVRQLVQLHGGEVELINRPEGGACFGFTLPRGEDAHRQGARG